MIEVVSENKPNRRQWLALTPDLVEALEVLARKENVSLEALLISLINEALTHRLNKRL